MDQQQHLAQLFATTTSVFDAEEVETVDTTTYLTFMIGEEEYGLGIVQVLEIVSELPITPVPGSPPEVLGVANLRGRVISVLSLRRRFHLEDSEDSIVVVVETEAGVMGLAVDKVQDVARIADAELEPAPEHGMPIDTVYVQGIAKGEQHIRILLDADKMVRLREQDDDEDLEV